MLNEKLLFLEEELQSSENRIEEYRLKKAQKSTMRKKSISYRNETE